MTVPSVLIEPDEPFETRMTIVDKGKKKPPGVRGISLLAPERKDEKGWTNSSHSGDRR